MPHALNAARRACAVALALVSVLFLSTSSFKCLVMPNSSQANGTEAIQWTCNDDTDQRWS
ncbi:RICIN domain-containing protein [Streptomyces mirabilis]